MAITIINRRIDPYTQKNDIKAIFGDTMIVAFTLPEPYVAGDEYTLGLDYERIVFPTVRPVCALSQDYFITGSDITFTIELNTERFAKWVSGIKKPMPIWMQIVRVRGDVSETLLLDDILAIPSVIDGENTVFPGDPIDELLDKKLDAPEEEGEPGQVLKLGEDGEPIWANGGGGGGTVTWDDIEDKPEFAEVATTGSYNDLTDRPTIPAAQVQADWTQSNTSAVDYIKHKPSLAAVATTGDYNDLLNKPTIPTVGSGIITITQGGTSKGSFSVNQTTAQTIEIDAGGAASWDDIEGKPDFATVATTGSYTDLADKPTIPTVNDATITLTQGGVSKGSFSVNQSSPQTIDFDAYTLNTSIITIPIPTTSYTLADGLIYQHTPESASTYQLPIITDTTHTHTIVLTVYAHSTTSWRIIDQDGTSTLVPLDTITPVLGDIIQYIIQSTPAGLWAASASYLQRGA